ncbi:MAG: SIMPL domain-containing protein [Minisyncoccus archaeiphilus]|uniref:SIMPL domain-containing protein n=1 Tax=Minisyncoccus archaeiphilus TaxID=3238481 RepID=UPI0009CA25B6|nr:MAG: 26 kDa periplasmic immunogenic protein precursor [Parcubacteria group bacterium ADurb.Bin216]GMX59419.1 MAG: SIMPL domain-containing protein [Candidatus Parcubacteria bacterium]
MNILENKTFHILTFTFIIVLTVLIATMINEKIKPNENNLITVTGTGEIYAVPDIGVVTISVRTEKDTVETVTTENNKKINAIVSFLKGKGIEEKDIKTTNFNINPVYSWNPDSGERKNNGYEANQGITVKIREIAKAGEIIAGATENGANDISNLSFIVDDNESVKDQARKVAIDNAKEKAKILEEQLGVKMVKIVNFSEGSYIPTQSSYDAYNAGGSMMKEAARVSAPDIQAGESKIISTVTITYSID